jgi:hypothetical protein
MLKQPTASSSSLASSRTASSSSLTDTSSNAHLSIGEMLLGVTSRRKFIETETDELLSEDDEDAFLSDFDDDDDDW